MSRFALLAVAFQAIGLAVCSSALAATLRVPSEHLTINAALDASSPGDTVLVAPGTYTDSEIRMDGPFTLRSCVYMVDGVALRSEAGPEVTTIDMLGAGVGAIATVIRVAVAPAPGEILVEGFTVTGAPPSYGGAFVASAVTSPLASQLAEEWISTATLHLPLAGVGGRWTVPVDVTDIVRAMASGEIGDHGFILLSMDVQTMGFKDVPTSSWS